MQLTKSELEIMNVIWSEGRGLTRNEIISLSENKSWKDSSIHILLNGLLDKRAVKVTGMVRCGKTYARLFDANITCGEYYAKSVLSAVDKEIVMQMADAMINSPEFTDDMAERLAVMLEERRSRSKKK